MAINRLIILALVVAGTAGAQTLSDRFGDSLVGYWGAQGYSKSNSKGDVLEFDGTGDYVEVSGFPDESVVGSTGTISFWLKKQDTSVAGLVSFDGSSPMIYADGGQVKAVNNGSYLDLVGIETNQWYHCVITWDGANGGTIYLNGNWAGGDGSWDTDMTRGTGLYLGSYPNGNNPLNGSLSNVRIYDRALSGNEVDSLYDGYNITNGLVGYWPLDGDYEDDSGNDNDGTANGDPTFQTELLPSSPLTMYDASGRGNDGTANGDAYYDGDSMVFDGDGDYVEDDTQLVSDYPFTVSIWGKYNNDGGTFFNLADKDDNSTQYAMQTHPVSGDMYLRVYKYAPDFAGACGNTILSASTWYHLTAVFLADEVKIYVNGEYDGSLNNSQGYSQDTDRWSIGRSGDSSPGGYFNGNTAHPMIFNRALSADEIQWLYHNVRPEGME